jgi:hypothetical protein
MISKLCCPACWRLFRLLTKSSTLSTLFTVRGYHSVPYPVELPVWLPEEVVNELIEFFRPILVDLLKSMDIGHYVYEEFKKVHRSQESESNLSENSAVSSNVSDGDKRLGTGLDEYTHKRAGMHGWSIAGMG